MIPKVYNFDKREVTLRDIDPVVQQDDTSMENYVVTDYFQYYTTGVESVISKAPSRYVVTNQYENERPEVLTNALYDNENLSDMVLAINNRTYLFSSPFDPDISYEILEAYTRYFRKISNISDADSYTQSQFENYYKPLLQERFSDDLLSVYNNYLRQVILPKTAEVERVMKDIKDYFKSRKVE